jgi:hypothetical protein
MSDEKPMDQVIQIDEARIRDHLGEMVRGTVARPLGQDFRFYCSRCPEMASFGISPVPLYSYRSRRFYRRHDPYGRWSGRSPTVSALGLQAEEGLIPQTLGSRDLSRPHVVIIMIGSGR